VVWLDRYEVCDGVIIHNSGSVYIPEQGLVAVADFHVGYESTLRDEGVAMPFSQKEKLWKRIDRVLATFSPEKMVVVGDFKHAFDRNLRQEWEEVEELVERISDRTKLVVVRGNHDNYLATILSRKKVDFVDYYTEGDVLFVHGHRDPGIDVFDPRWRCVVFGHEHPAVKLRDTVGGLVKIPCFLHHPRVRLVVLPALSPLAEGNDVLRAERFFSPLLRNVDVGEAEVFGVTDLGLLYFSSVRDLQRAITEL